MLLRQATTAAQANKSNNRMPCQLLLQFSHVLQDSLETNNRDLLGFIPKEIVVVLQEK